VYREKLIYMIASQNLGAKGNRDTAIKNEILEKVNQFKYLEANVTSKNEVTEEIESHFASDNACF